MKNKILFDGGVCKSGSSELVVRQTTELLDRIVNAHAQHDLVCWNFSTTYADNTYVATVVAQFSEKDPEMT